MFLKMVTTFEAVLKEKDQTIVNLSARVTQLEAAKPVEDVQSEVRISSEKVVEGKIAPLQKIVENHQRFLDKEDAAKRAANILITGVPECDNDEAKVASILTAIQCPDITIKKVVRLGQLNADRGTKQRPILVETGSIVEKKKVMMNKGKLKGAGDDFKRIYIKSDQSLAIRKEWSRLKEVMKRESQLPMNTAVTYKIDYKKGNLLRDGQVIDSFKSPFRKMGPNQ